MSGFLPHFLWEEKKKRWRKRCEPTPLILPILCSLHGRRRAQIYLTFLTSRTSGAHTRAPHGSASPQGTGSQDLRRIPWLRPSEQKPSPLPHTLARWVRQSQDGTQGHLRAHGEETGPRTGWEHKSEPGSALLRATKSDRAQRSPGMSMVARQVQESKWAPRSRVSTAREGHGCSWTGD